MACHNFSAVATPMTEDLPVLSIVSPGTSAKVTLADGTAFFQPAKVTWHTGRGLEVDFDFEVIDGRPAWLGMHVHPTRFPPGSTAALADAELTATRLRDLPLDRVVAAAVDAVARVATAWTPEGLHANVQDEEFRPAGEAAVRAHRRRRKMDDELLRRVAQIVRDDMTGAPRQAVADLEHASPRTASRWIALAQDRGFLEKEEQ